MKKLLGAFALLCALFLFASCNPEQGIIEVTSVSLDKTELTMTVGKTDSLSATVSPSDATDVSVKWTSSNEGIATVADGTVTAVGIGEAIITVSSTSNPSITATCKVTVSPVTVTSISLNKEATTIAYGEEETLIATISPENAADKNITWTSSNETIATVSDGKVTAVGIGSCTITATSSNPEIKAECTVTISHATMTLSVNNYEGEYDGQQHGEAATASIETGTTVEYSVDNGSTWTTDVPQRKDAGTTTVKARATNANYVTAENSYTITVTAKAVTVTSDDKVKNSNDADPELTATVTGLVEGESVNYKLTRATGENAGEYTITPSGDATQGNYTVSFVSSGKLTINPVVTFNMKGHGTAIDSKNVTLNGKVSDPVAPTDEAYDFQGWFIDDACETSYDFDSAVSSNLTLYAKWTIKHYTVTFDMGGHGTQVASQEVNHGNLVSAFATPEETGYAFVKWYKDSSLTMEFDLANDTVTSVMTLYAKWRIPVTSIVIAGDATRTMNSGDSLVLTATVYPENATNKNFTWTSSNSTAAPIDASGKVTAKTAANAPVTITATSESDPSVTATVTINLAQTAAVFNMGSGVYKRLTWEELKVSENGTLYGYDASVISDTEIGTKAFYYTEKLERLDIPSGVTTIASQAFACAGKGSTFINNVYVTIPVSVTTIGGSIFDNSCGIITYEGTSYQWRAISKTGSWSNLLLGNNAIRCSDVCLNKDSDHTVDCRHAEHKANFKTVTFDANGGTGTQSSIYPAYGPLPIPTTTTFDSPNAELTFRGWSYTSEGSRISTKTIDVTDNMTLYAVWAGIGATNAEELQEAFNVGGTVKLASNIQGCSLVVPAGITVTLDLNGYVFDAEQKGRHITNNGTLTIIDSNPTAVHTGAYADLPAGGVLYHGLVAQSYGGSIMNSASDKVLNLNGGTIYECTAKGGGAIYQGKVTIEGNVLIKNCHATGSDGGGAIYFAFSLNFNRGVIEGCTAVNGSGGACSSSDWKLGQDAIIRNCSAKNGGAVARKGTIDGRIENCSATAAGGAFSGYDVSMREHAVITGCSAPVGGAIAIISDTGTTTITGGSITNCTATERGGAIYYENLGSSSSYKMTINNLTINGCEAGISAGGIFARVLDSAKIVIADTVAIQNCSAGLAGGSMVKTVVEDLSSMPTISGCKVGGVDNNDIYTGVAKAGTLIFKYFTLDEKENMASADYFTPAGAYNPEHVTYTLSTTEYATVDENGVVTPTKVTRVPPYTYTFDLKVTSVIEGVTQNIQGQVYKFVLDKNSVSLVENSIGTTRVTYSGTETISACTSKDETVATVSFVSNTITITGHKAGTTTIDVKQNITGIIKTIEVTVKAPEPGDILGTHTSADETVTKYITSSDDFKQALEVDGTIQLLSDITTYGGKVTAKNLTLDLNGHVLDGAETGKILTLSNSTNFILMDSKPTSKHGSEEYKDLPDGGVLYRGKNSSNGSGAGLTVGSGTTATIKGGTFYQCNSSFNDMSSSSYFAGGAIGSRGNLNIEGGSFLDCSSALSGGAITTTVGTLNITGGSFINCDATQFGGAIYVQTGKASISNATFSNCDSKYGGAICGAVSFTLDKVSISNCSAEYFGGAVYVPGGTLTINGTAEKPFRIENCKTTLETSAKNLTRGGGGIMINTGGTVNVQGYATISGCTTKGNGGAILNRGTFTVDGENGGDLTISNCSADSGNAESKAGAIYNYSGTLNLTGTAEHGILISGCTAVGTDAGAVYIGASTTAAKITYTTIKGNGSSDPVAAKGGALYIKKAGVTIENSTFQDCYTTSVGGGIWSDQDLTLNKVSFSNCGAAENGGAVYLNGGILTINGTAEKPFSIENCTTTTATTSNNATYGGGGIMIASGTATVQGYATISGCTSKGNGGAIYNKGTFTVDGEKGGELKITDCSVDDTNDEARAGAIYNYTGTLNLTGTAEHGIVISGCKAVGTDAGAVYIGASTIAAKITYTTITGKDSSEAVAAHGGALYIKKAGVTIENSTFQDCYTTSTGGGIWSNKSLTLTNVTISGMKSDAGGGGIYARDANNTVTLAGTTTITGCSAKNGGGIYFNNDGTTKLVMKNTSKITQCKATGSGGGVGFGTTSSTLTMSDDAMITECSATSDGGVSGCTTKTITGNATISNCTPS